MFRFSVGGRTTDQTTVIIESPKACAHVMTHWLCTTHAEPTDWKRDRVGDSSRNTLCEKSPIYFKIFYFILLLFVLYSL